ncbi:MAG: chemotaxis protein CheW [Vulcanimicrobiota bacterium]
MEAWRRGRLLLVFGLGDEAYALDASRVLRVLPAIAPRPIPQTPAFVAGVIDYLGQALPVIDLCQLCLGRACEPWLSTRILLVDYGPGPLGVMVERLTRTTRQDTSEFKPAGVDGPPFLGGLQCSPQGLTQLLSIDELLTDEVRAILYPDLAS